MQVAAQEAVTADQVSVAKCALVELQKMFDENPNAEAAQGDRAVVLSNIVRIIQDTPDQPADCKCYMIKCCSQLSVIRQTWLTDAMCMPV